MKRRKFNQLMLSSSLASAFLPIAAIMNKNKTELDYLLGKSTSHLVDFDGHQLEKQSLKAYLQMKEAALNDGVCLEIVSAFRSFNRQQEIFEKKYSQFRKESSSNLETIQKITTYSSIPGTSRHHWGTDLDLIDGSVDLPKSDLLTEKHYLANGVFAKMYKWMQENANIFGFIETYPDNQHERKGYFFEPWHYSYQPVSQLYIKRYIENQLIEKVRNENLVGINQLSEDFFINYQKEFILGIHENLLP